MYTVEVTDLIREIHPDNSMELYNYFITTGVNTPYYFPVSYESWNKSMFNDCDYDGTALFSKLKTFVLIKNEIIEGYIQFGVSSFIFDESGERNFSKGYGVIRSLHYLQNSMNATMLFNKAMEYFNEKNIKERYAFFHYLGMSCYARQGKLHETGFYMEDILTTYSFIKEHENVYFSRCLHKNCPDSPQDIVFSYSNNQQSIKFMRDDKEIGGCELYLVPNSRVCFLKWIYINKNLSHQGLGTKCMHKLFNEMRQKGFVRIDTDTIGSNTNAQKYYEKTGFINMGIMRSYSRSGQAEQG